MPKTKEDMLKARFPFYNPDVYGKDVELNGETIMELMELYAKQQAIAYSIFKREYQLIEGMDHKHDTTDKIGMVSWIGASDERIWSAYKDGKQILRWIENPEHPDNRLSKIKSKEP